MGLSASQARFLQLTGRKSNVEYQAQRITFERLEIATKTMQASTEYNDKMSNRKVVFTFNNGEGLQNVDLTYENYKQYMNQQKEGLSTSHQKYYLVSSSGKLVVSSKEERDAWIEANTKYIPIDADSDPGDEAIIKRPDENGNIGSYLAQREYTESDFIIADDLDDPDNFQDAIKNGTYFFATRELDEGTGKQVFKSQGWDVLGGGALSETYDTSDDAVAEAEYKKQTDSLQVKDKKLEMELNRLESERSAIQTELDSVQNVIEKNIEGSFKTFG